MAIFPAYDPDYAAHLAICQHLESQGLWPLPYHGLIGSHVLALGVRWLFATSLSAAMGITFIAATLVTLLALSRDLRSASVALGFSLPLILHMAGHGFYSQVVGFAPYAWALRFLHQGQQRRALVCTLIAIPFYPDCAMFLLPAIRLSPWTVLTSVALFAGQASQLGDPGAAHAHWLPQFLLAGALLISQPRKVALPFAIISIGMVLASLLLHGAVTYYARKNFYALALLLPFASRHALLPLAGYVAFSLTPHARIPLWQWHAPSFDAHAESCARQFQGVCHNPAIIPPDGKPNERAQQVIGFGAFIGGDTLPFAPVITDANDCVVSQSPQDARVACAPWYLAPRPLSP